MQVRVGCEFIYETEAPVPMLMQVKIRPDGPHRAIFESRWTDPVLPVHEYVDGYGNPCWRLLAPGGRLTVRYDAVVEMERKPDPVVPTAAVHPVQDLPDDTLVYTLPSRYAESDLLLDAAWKLFVSTPPTWERVQAICDWVHTNLRFETGSTGPTNSARDAYERRVGVCRDFALLSVALCRAMNIPARYAFGYLPDIDVEPPDVAMDFHSWFEAYLGGRWYTFDARHNEPRVGRIVVGRGRDAADVALTTSYGLARLRKMTVWSDEVSATSKGGPPVVEDADALEAFERTAHSSEAHG